jgi:hypothetical protein
MVFKASARGNREETESRARCCSYVSGPEETRRSTLDMGWSRERLRSIVMVFWTRWQRRPCVGSTCASTSNVVVTTVLKAERTRISEVCTSYLSTLALHVVLGNSQSSQGQHQIRQADGNDTHTCDMAGPLFASLKWRAGVHGEGLVSVGQP